MGRGIGYGRGKWSEIMVYYFIFGGGGSNWGEK